MGGQNTDFRYGNQVPDFAWIRGPMSVGSEIRGLAHLVRYLEKRFPHLSSVDIDEAFRLVLSEMAPCKNRAVLKRRVVHFGGLFILGSSAPDFAKNYCRNLRLDHRSGLKTRI